MGFKLGKKFKKTFGKAALGFAGGFLSSGGNLFSGGIGGITAASRKGPATIKRSMVTGAVTGFGTSVVLGALGAGGGVLGKTAGLYANPGMAAGSKLAGLWKGFGGGKGRGAGANKFMSGGGEVGATEVARALEGGETATPNQSNDWLPIAAIAGGALLLL